MKWLVGVLIVALLVLTACGNKDVIDDTTNQETQPTQPTETDQPANDVPLGAVVDETPVIGDTEETDPLAGW